MYYFGTTVRRGRIRNGRAQLAALDVILVVVIITTAASILQNAVMRYGDTASPVSDTYMTHRAEATLRVLLRTTVDTDELCSLCGAGTISPGGWRPVSEVLAEYLFICTIANREDPTAGAVLESIVCSILTNLTAPAYGFVLKAEYKSSRVSISISDADGRDVVYAEENYPLTVTGSQEAVCFKLGLWRF